MGDIIHTLPALTDAKAEIPSLTCDWVIEENFAEIPTWHPAVSRVIPIAFRKWRKALFSCRTWRDYYAVRRMLKASSYDVILDAQGLIKSALFTLTAKGMRFGLDFASARESFASFAYQRKFTVNFYQHAVKRMRLLFSLALGYAMPKTFPQYGLSPAKTTDDILPYLVFLHGTTWASKEWPESYWGELAQLAARSGFTIKISGGSEREIARAERIAKYAPGQVEVLPRLDIAAMRALLLKAAATVSVDTGFGHLAVALGVPTIMLHGATDPAWTGALGQAGYNIKADFSCSPCLNRECRFKGASLVKPACYAKIKPDRVWRQLLQHNLCKNLGKR